MVMEYICVRCAYVWYAWVTVTLLCLSRTGAWEVWAGMHLCGHICALERSVPTRTHTHVVYISPRLKISWAFSDTAETYISDSKDARVYAKVDFIHKLFYNCTFIFYSVIINLKYSWNCKYPHISRDTEMKLCGFRWEKKNTLHSC